MEARQAMADRAKCSSLSGGHIPSFHSVRKGFNYGPRGHCPANLNINTQTKQVHKGILADKDMAFVL